MFPVPAWIDPTGATDMTSALNQFLASVPNGSIVAFPAGATYLIEGTLTLTKSNFELNGNGATLQAATTYPTSWNSNQIQNRAILKLVGGSNVTVRGFTLIGINSNPGHFTYSMCCQHGVQVLSTQGALVTGNTVRNVYGDNVYVFHAVGNDQPARNVVISDNGFSGNGRQAVALVHSDGVWILRNVFGDTGQTFIDFEPGMCCTVVNQRVIIDGNDFAGRSPTWKISASVMNHDLWVQNNTAEQGAMSIIVGCDSCRPYNIYVLNNVGDLPNSTNSMSFKNADNIIVQGNQQPLRPPPYQQNVVMANYCDSMDIQYNIFTNADNGWSTTYQGTSNTNVIVANNQT